MPASPISRRSILATAAMLPLAVKARSPGPGNAGTILIDAQGGLDFPFDDKAKAALAQSGLTAISMTVGKVGNGEDRYTSMLEEAAFWRGVVDANPALLGLVRAPGDIAA